MIENNQHAFEILRYILPGEKDVTLKKMISNVTFIGAKNARVIDSEKFWDELVLGTELSLSFIKKKKISSLEELISSHHNWKMKYQWGIYKQIMPTIDYLFDELDSTNYLD